MTVYWHANVLSTVDVSDYECFCDDVQDSQSKQSGYSMHQLQGNKEFGSEKKGYLFKKSDG